MKIHKNTTVIKRCIKCGKKITTRPSRMNRPGFTGLCHDCLHHNILDSKPDKGELGDVVYVRRTSDKCRTSSWIWKACPDCGKERWVENLKRNINHRCQKCRCKEESRALTVDKRKITLDRDGYCWVSLPLNHWAIPMAKKAGNKSSSFQISIHRLVMAEHLKRLLTKGELVHHINGNRSDNRIENLKLTTRQSHETGYINGYKQGFHDGQEGGIGQLRTENEELMKHIKFLEFQLKNLNQVDTGAI